MYYLPCKALIALIFFSLVAVDGSRSKVLDFDKEVDKLEKSKLIVMENQPINLDYEVERLEKLFEDNNCFSFHSVNNQKFTTNFAKWNGIHIQFYIINTCTTAKPINNLQFFISGYKINGDSSLFYASQVLSSPWLLASPFKADGKGNVNFGVSTQSQTQSWAFIKPQGKVSIKVSSWPSVPITSFAITDIKMDQLPVLKGDLKVFVDAKSISELCPKSDSCNIAIDILHAVNNQNNVIKTVGYNPYLNPIFDVTITQLIEGTYKIHVKSSSLPNVSSDVGEITVKYEPTSVEVKKDQVVTAKAIINFIKHEYGSINLSIKAINSNRFANIGGLKGRITGNTNNKLVDFTLSQGENKTFSKFPLDTYTLSIQGMGSPLTGEYFHAKSLQATVTKNQVSNAEFEFVKQAAFKVNFVSTNTPLNQAIVFASSNYKYLNTLLKTGDYYFIEQTSTKITTNYIVTTVPSPLIIKSGLTQATVTFKKNEKPAVPGWPSNYIATGTITLNSGLKEGTGRPFDSVFKYSGSNGAGDLGQGYSVP